MLNLILSRHNNTTKKIKKPPKITNTEAPQPTPKNTSTLTDLGYDVTNNSATPANFSTQQTAINLGSLQNLFMIYLTAPKDRPFLGYELIQALLAAGLRHGAMGLFHYYDAQGKIIVSVAQTTQTGEFDLDKMGNITCRGLILFMQKSAPIEHYDKLKEIAHELAEELDGQLRDTKQQPLVELI